MIGFQFSETEHAFQSEYSLQKNTGLGKESTLLDATSWLRSANKPRALVISLANAARTSSGRKGFRILGRKELRVCRNFFDRAFGQVFRWKCGRGRSSSRACECVGLWKDRPSLRLADFPLALQQSRHKHAERPVNEGSETWIRGCSLFRTVRHVKASASG